jgi:FAD/FMN-containing dehydrogenase
MNDQERASLACRIGSAVFKSQYVDIHTAGPQYLPTVNLSWSEACWLPAACIVHPEAAQDVARVTLVITFLKSRFAVRSGGYNPNPGFAGIDSTGVLIDTGGLKEVRLSEDKTLVRVGTGTRFRAVYHDAALIANGRSIIGGRTEAVGAGGFCLDGGMAFFSSTYGISASQVRNFEVSNDILGFDFIVVASHSSSNENY